MDSKDLPTVKANSTIKWGQTMKPYEGDPTAQTVSADEVEYVLKTEAEYWIYRAREQADLNAGHGFELKHENGTLRKQIAALQIVRDAVYDWWAAHYPSDPMSTLDPVGADSALLDAIIAYDDNKQGQ